MGAVPDPISIRDPTDVGSIDRDEVFDVLSNQRRLYVLHYLKRENGDSTVSFGELVDHVAAWENDTTVDQLDAAERKSVYTALRQSHLPKLEDVGIVDYDDDLDEIELTETGEAVQLYLEYVPRDDISWSQYYLGLSSLCALLVASAWIGVPLLSALSWPVLLGVIIAAFLLSSIVHTYRIRTNELGVEGALSPIKPE